MEGSCRNSQPLRIETVLISPGGVSAGFSQTHTPLRNPWAPIGQGQRLYPFDNRLGHRRRSSNLPPPAAEVDALVTRPQLR
ncbi:hypothetical protein MTO96_037192 [Rhipicephalus appendiculatus]